MKFKHKITQLSIAGTISSCLVSGLILSVIAVPSTNAQVAEISNLAQSLAPE
ncbi:MAG: hypothetical protein RLZZ74_2146, partial [Cyanobacteriota bacterium]